MAITLSTPARDAACNGVVDLLDVGGAGTLQIATTAFGSVLATLTLTNPAFGASSTGTATAAAITSDTNTVAGTAAVFRLRNNATTTVISGSVGTGSGDINFNSLAFTTGGTCSVSSLTYTQPAS